MKNISTLILSLVMLFAGSQAFHAATITRDVTDPERAFRYKWIDFLSEIQEVVVTGKDVEVQPYFLYYEGQETSDGQHPDDHIKTVRLGEEVKSLGRGSFSLYELKNLYCYRQTPPTLPAAR